jgi:hypothetical protein
MPRKRGRPTREAARAKVLSELAEVDPDVILREIANNPREPATARVQACREMRLRRQAAPGEAREEEKRNRVVERALEYLNGPKRTLQ